MRRSIALASAVTLVLAALLVTGCGDKAELSQPQPSAPSTAVTPPSAPTDEIAALLQKGAAVQTLSFEGTMSSGKVSYAVKGWVLGKKARLERTLDGTTMNVLYDFDAKAAWIWGKGSKTGTKSAAPAMVSESPAWWAGVLAPQPWKTNQSGELGGAPCRIVGYVYSGSGDTVDTTLWIAEDTGLPVQLEANLNGVTTKYSYTRVAIAAPAGDLFVVPSDVTFVETH